MRLDAYSRALQQVINPSKVVLDIGTGTGIFALLACKYGARKVYAVEPSDIVQLARENAIANKYLDRIEFIQGGSQDIDLPEKVDVIVSDLRGVLPLFGDHLPTIIDARKRFLKPAGVLLPIRDRLWAAITSAAETYERNLAPWESKEFGLDVSAGRRREVNAWWKVNLGDEQLLVPPICWATLNYCEIESPNVETRLSWTIEKPGVAHGLCVWFDSELGEGVTFSNAPGSLPTVYGTALFPFPEPIQLDAGDEIEVSLAAILTGEGYVWRWDTKVMDARGVSNSERKFQQSTFYSKVVSPDNLRKRSTQFVPKINIEGTIDSYILSLMNGSLTLTEIAIEVAKQFPANFTNAAEAQDRVRKLSQIYSQ